MGVRRLVCLPCKNQFGIQSRGEFVLAGLTLFVVDDGVVRCVWGCCEIFGYCQILIQELESLAVTWFSFVEEEVENVVFDGHRRGERGIDERVHHGRKLRLLSYFLLGSSGSWSIFIFILGIFIPYEKMCFRGLPFLF
jgi:hypothetical protein